MTEVTVFLFVVGINDYFLSSVAYVDFSNFINFIVILLVLFDESINHLINVIK